MIPIRELLARIHWDKSFSDAQFRIGYYDRVENKLLYVALNDIHFPSDDHFAFQLVDEDGMTHTIPLHRIKEVWRDEALIWQRTH